MNKEDVLWLTEMEQELLEDKGWKLIFLADHYNGHYWYEIKDPYGSYLDFRSDDPYKTIDRINQEIEKEKNGRSNSFFKRMLL